jgi:hypothetical protein
MSNELCYTTRGIYFWPYSAKFKPKLVNFDESLIKSVVRKVKDSPEFKMAAEPSVPSHPNAIATPIDNDVGESRSLRNSHCRSSSSGNVRLFHKTEFPDVYDVYTNDGGVRTKVGVASIPNLKTSKMMRAVFKDVTVAVYIPFTCEYQADIDKWFPLEAVATSKNES